MAGGTQKQARRFQRVFIRDHLAVVSHWAKRQLLNGADTREQGLRLQRLIEAADALRAELPSPDHLASGNVVPLAHTRAAGDLTHL